ncbi:MAG: excisionase [Ruminococcus sp.]|nr:excisionase [Ruminococcus sp.]
MKPTVPIWQKFTLTVEEAAVYFRIGENKLRQIMSENRNADFILWNGNRPQIKRQKFEEFVNNLHNI